MDLDSNRVALFLSGKEINMIEAFKIYYIEHLRYIKHDKERDSIQLKTASYSKIREGSENKNELFDDVRLAEQVITGHILMFPDLDFYKSCPEHR